MVTETSSNGVWVAGDPVQKEHRPTRDEIMSLYKEGANYFNAFHSQCTSEEDYYNGNRTVPVPKNADGLAAIDAVWPATANAIVNVATDHVDVNNLQIDVPSTARSRARAERIKKFLLGTWVSIKSPVLRTAVRQSFLYGISFLKDMFDADKWPDAPHETDFDSEQDYKEALKEFMESRCIKWPIDIGVVNPRNLIWDDSSARMKWVIEVQKRSVSDLKRRFPEWVHHSPSDMAEWVEYWDEEWVAYLADGEFVFGPEKHGYGHMPYTPILPVHTYTFQDGSPESRFRGILYYIHSLLDEEARLLTQIGTIVRTTSYRTLDFSGPRAQAEEAAADYELFGGKNIMPPGVQVSVSPMVVVPPNIGEQLSRIQTYIEMATFPNVIRGMRPQGVSSGFHTSVLAGMGRLVFQGVADGVRHAVEQANSKFLQLVENKLKGRVTVYARNDIHRFDQTIGPEDIRGYHENIVMVKAEAPEERERESLLALRLHAAGVISLYEAQRRSGITNPLEEQMQIRAEQLLNTPEAMQAQVQMLMQRVGLPGQLAEAVAPTQGAPPPGTPPGGPSNPGAQNIGGAQLPRPGERNIQQARVASNQGNASVFPRGLGGLDQLGQRLGSPTGGAQGMPSGQTVR